MAATLTIVVFNGFREASQKYLSHSVAPLTNVWLVRHGFAVIEMGYERSRFRPFVGHLRLSRIGVSWVDAYQIRCETTSLWTH